MFEYILLVAILGSIVANYFLGRYFAKKTSSFLSAYRIETLRFSETQKQNTAKLVELLNRLFVTTENSQPSKPEPNDIGKVNPDEIEFTEQSPISLPPDVKFEVEGGDTFIPPGYPQKPN